MKPTGTGTLDEQHRQQLLTFFLDHLYQISAEQDVDSLLQQLADAARDLKIADRCTIWLLDGPHLEILTQVAHGIRPLRLPLDKGLIGHAIRHAEPVIANDVYNDPRFFSAIDEETGYQTRNMLVIPIFNGRMEAIGAFQALNKPDDQPFDDEDLTVLSIITLLISKLLDNVESRDFINSIFDFISRIAKERDMRSALWILDDMGRTLTHCERCTIWMLDRERGELWTRIAHGVDELRVPMDSGVVGYATQHNEVIIIDDAYSDDRFNQEIDKQTGYHTRNILVMPICDSKGDPIGAFQAVNKLGHRDRFAAVDIEILRLSATYAGKTLESILLQQELEDTQREVIYRLGEIAEWRSKETGNHVKRVAEYSRLLAEGVGMSSQEVEILRLASPMHDVGKIAIPDQVLNKPGRHTPEEFLIMKTHAQIGYDMLHHSKRPILAAAAIVAGEHHERYDGEGYPNKKAGDDIHIYGRITAIADVFDALSSDRCYKKAWPMEQIITLMREESDGHFDPALINVFFDNLDGFLRIQERYKDECVDKTTHRIVEDMR